MGQIFLVCYLVYLVTTQIKLQEKIFEIYREDLNCIREKECLLGIDQHVASLTMWKTFIESSTPGPIVNKRAKGESFLTPELLAFLPPDSDHPDGGPYDRASPFWCWLGMESEDEKLIGEVQKFYDCWD